jgi:hypothetical protein
VTAEKGGEAVTGKSRSGRYLPKRENKPICRQRIIPGGDCTGRELAGTSLSTGIHLTEQPSGAKLEYRVKAENNIAPSEPSNSVFAVL